MNLRNLALEEVKKPLGVFIINTLEVGFNKKVPKERTNSWANIH